MSVLLSIVIPTYRRPDLLKKCLFALAHQDFPFSQFEIIVVSDGPDSATTDMINEFKEEFKQNPDLHFLFTDVKKGPAAARNLGWKEAKGELVAFTDDDCVPASDWLASYYRSYLACNKKLISFTGKVIVPIPKLPTDYEKNVSNLETADFITANCACSKQALEQINGFDEEFPIAWREDSALEFALLKQDIPILKIETAVVTHPVREVPWGISLKEQKKSMFNALLFKKFPELYRRKISAQPVWSYYGIIILSVATVTFFVINKPLLAMIAAVLWFYLIVDFIFKRLKHTNLSVSHKMEMIFTSLMIPYLSVFWTLRGAIRYNVFFL